MKTPPPQPPQSIPPHKRHRLPKHPHHPIGQPQKLIGHVKWFSEARGYGFLTAPQHAEVFVHFSAIQVPGHKTLQEGQMVVFRVGENDKGQTIALDVVPVKDPNAPPPAPSPAADTADATDAAP